MNYLLIIGIALQSLAPPTVIREANVPEPKELAGFPNATFRWYGVSGTTVDEIRRSLDASSLSSDDRGRTFPAKTESSITWRGIKQADKSGCRLRKVEMLFNVRCILPRLEAPQLVQPNVLQRWNKYLNKLYAHESGHAHNAFDHLDEARTAIVAGGCINGDKAGIEVLDRYRQVDAAYERDTDNGRMQGAVFP